MEAGFVLYLLVKTVAYIAWSGWGARIHGHRERLALKAVLFGLLRLAMGAVLGLIVIVLLVNLLARSIPSQPVLYLAVYVPVRWIEWSTLAVLMDAGNRSMANFAIGRSAPTRLWRLGGIVISCLADIPHILELNGLPVGRFMC